MGPRDIYVIYPYNEERGFTDVYVGSSGDVPERIKAHLRTSAKSDYLIDFHNKMRRNGFAYQIVDHMSGISESRKEYDWIKFFSECSDLRVVNKLDGSSFHDAPILPKPEGNTPMFIKDQGVAILIPKIESS